MSNRRQHAERVQLIREAQKNKKYYSPEPEKVLSLRYAASCVALGCIINEVISWLLK